MLSSNGRACILAIGTELTTGQITNRNAAWLSERLTDLGALVVLHETVADERSHILAALERCASMADMLVITGGLGPTSDDFTREVIAQWLNQPLIYDEDSWTQITSRLARLGIPVAESNRKQCHFPEKARILHNDQGTANGFFAINTSHPQPVALWVLPGPPREIAAIWERGGMREQVAALIPGFKPKRLFTWQCVGKSESELGEIVEETMAGSGLQTGYRAHRPYVEIKIWCEEDEVQSKQAWLDRLDAALRPWTATRMGADLGGLLLQEVARFDEIDIYDAATCGCLAKRLGDAWAIAEAKVKQPVFTVLTEWSTTSDPRENVEKALEDPDRTGAARAEDDQDDGLLVLALAGFDPKGRWALGLRFGSNKRVEELSSPFHRPEAMDRARLLATELALKKWRDWLRESTH